MEQTIKELGIYISDGNYSSKYPRSEEFVEEGVPFIRGNNMVDYDITDEEMYYIIYTYSYECKNVNDFFIEPYKDMVDNCFTEYEKNAIVEPLMNDCNEHNINVTICNLIAIFRGMNFLKKKYATSNSLDNIYSNEYFRINNWDGKISESCFREVQNDQVEELLQTLMKSTDYTTIIPHN